MATGRSQRSRDVLREMKVELQEAGLLDEEDKYGVSLPDARHTLVSAALSRRYSRG